MSAVRKLQRSVIREGVGNKMLREGWKKFMSGELKLRKHHTRMVNSKKAEHFKKKEE